jgi:hypothetical protein
MAGAPHRPHRRTHPRHGPPHIAACPRFVGGGTPREAAQVAKRPPSPTCQSKPRPDWGHVPEEPMRPAKRRNNDAQKAGERVASEAVRYVVHRSAYRLGDVPASRYGVRMQTRPPGVPHPLSWARRLDPVPWESGQPAAWGYDDPRDLEDRELAFELARCAVDLDVSLAQAARKLRVGSQRANRAMHQLRDEAAPRRGAGRGPLSDSGIFKRLASERKREGRICLAPGCDREISPRKRVGTHACSGRCRKRIFDAGGREAILRRKKQQLLDAKRDARKPALPAASPLIVRCDRCGATFSGPAPSAEFRAHACTGKDAPATGSHQPSRAGSGPRARGIRSGGTPNRSATDTRSRS